MEGSLVAYKVFTNGSVLNASEINDNLMRQSVMVFSNAAARTAAITSPVEGMLTWLEDLNRYESYNGSAWVPSSSALVFLTSANLSGSSVQINNVFNSFYDSYLVVVSNARTTVASFCQLRLSVAGTPATANQYRVNQIYWSSGTLNGVQQLETGFKLSDSGTTDNAGGHSVVTLINPARTLPTSQHFSLQQNPNATIGVGVHENSTAYDGVTILTGNSFTSGQVRIYGYRNA